MHRIDLDFAFLKTFQGEADSHMFSRLHEKWCVRIFGRDIRGQTF